jgi:predicted nucleotidyltransferase
MVELHGYLGYGFIELAEKLEYILQKKVDLVSRDGLKPHQWNYLKSRILYV